jgi:phosphopantetheinyl transferase
MDARAQDDGTVRGTLFEADSEGMAAVLAEATFELTATRPELGRTALADEAVTPASWPPDELYRRTLYHGPAFQAVASVDACDRHAVRATVREPDPGLLVPTGADARLALPVALLDAAGQVAGMSVRPAWTAEEVQLTFPSRIERLEFARQLPPGTTLRTLARVRHEATQVVSDVEMTGPGGAPVLRALGRNEELVKLPADLYRYWTAPREASLSRPLHLAFQDVPSAAHCTVCAVGNVGGKYLANRFWQQVLAGLILSAEERRGLADLKLPPVPAASWLLGRAAAKDAVRLQAGLDGCLADVTLRTGPHGEPLVRPMTGPAPRVSLAHKAFAAVAVAADPDRFAGVGIDLEPLGPMDAGVKADAFTAAEQARIADAARAAEEPLDSWYLSAWGAKEALGKALGRGLIGGPRGVEVVAIDPAAGRLALAMRGTLAEAFPEHAARPPVDAYRRLHDGHVITLCLLAKA